MNARKPAAWLERQVLDGLYSTWLDSAGQIIGRTQVDDALLAAYRFGYQHGLRDGEASVLITPTGGAR